VEIVANHVSTPRKEMLEFISNIPKTSLEIGCIEGLFSETLKNIYKNIEVWGIEPNEKVNKEICKQNLDYFFQDFFPLKNDKLPEKYFDLIILNDVLEHMYDPWMALEECKKLLTDDGIIIVSLPNIRHKSVVKKLLFQNDFKYEDSGILDITHIRFFTTKTMISMFTKAELEIVKMKPLVSKKPLFKRIIHSYKIIFHILTFYKFYSMRYGQYGFTLKNKKTLIVPNTLV